MGNGQSRARASALQSSQTEQTLLQRVYENNDRDSPSRTMFGVLLDVSGSMEKAFALNVSEDTKVERVHAIITTILRIVKSEVNHHNRSDNIFVGAFGLENTANTENPINTSKAVDTCDLIALLNLIAGPKRLRKLTPHDALVQLARDHGAAHAERWIREHINKKDAANLFRVLCFEEDLVPVLVQKIPEESRKTSVLSDIRHKIPLGGKHIEGFAVHRTEAYCFAQELIQDMESTIKKKLSLFENPSPKSLAHVSDLLDDLNLKEDSSHSGGSQFLHSQIKELIDSLRPYIFGGTPMCKAIFSAYQIFQQSGTKHKVLLLLSDGESADGNPRETIQYLEHFNVVLVTCYLTDEHIKNPRCLMDQASPEWPKNDGRNTLFDISSTVKNSDPPVSFLIDAGWTLPASGESRLFVQANSLDVVNELCEIVVAELTNPCDALVDILEKVPLCQYITDKNATFKPAKQSDGTCCAHAIGTVFHLAMHRIVGRDGGYPEFQEVKDRLIREYGTKGAFAERIIAEVGPEYRLHYQQVDEIHARQALNHRRPLVTTFFLRKNQWDNFLEFYRLTPKGILQRADIGEPDCDISEPVREGDGGHAIVLIRCSPKCLVFLNSWGQDCGEGGFFKVKNAQVLDNIVFYDVYWTLNDLKQSEKDAYRREAVKKAKNLAATFPSINSLPFECPVCQRVSVVGNFKGDLMEAICPKCNQKFEPKNDDLAKSLYLKNC